MYRQRYIAWIALKMSNTWSAFTVSRATDVQGHIFSEGGANTVRKFRLVVCCTLSYGCGRLSRCWMLLGRALWFAIETALVLERLTVPACRWCTAKNGWQNRGATVIVNFHQGYWKYLPEKMELRPFLTVDVFGGIFTTLVTFYTVFRFWTRIIAITRLGYVASPHREAKKAGEQKNLTDIVFSSCQLYFCWLFSKPRS